MKILSDTWLSTLIKRETYRIQVDMSDLTNEKELNLFYQHLQIDNIFLYVKIPINYLEIVHFFQETKFMIADVNIVFEKKVSPISSLTNSNTKISFSVQSDREEVKELAKNTFKYSRFHMDKAFLPEQANLIKAEWANNYYLGNRGKWMIVAKMNNRIVGFLLILEGANKSLVIDLIGVHSELRNRGLARQMINYAEKELFSFHKMFVGTQLINTPSIHFYENMGFRTCKSYYILHYHNIKK